MYNKGKVKRLNRKDARRERNHQLILDTAFKLFLKHGIDNVGFHDIAEEADLARKTVYNHFNSKERIVEELFHPLLSEALSILNTLADKGPREHGSLLEKAEYYRSMSSGGQDRDVFFSDIIKVCMILYRTHKHRFAEMIKGSMIEAAAGLYVSSDLLELHKAFMAAFGDLIRQSYEHTSYRFAEPEICSRIILNCVFPLIDSMPEDMRTDKVIGDCLRGLLEAEVHNTGRL